MLTSLRQATSVKVIKWVVLRMYLFPMAIWSSGNSMVLLLWPKPTSSREASCKHSLLVNKSLFSFTFCEPLTKALVHSFPARPAAIVDRGDDLHGPEPLHKTLHLQKAAVFAVWDSCQESTGTVIIMDPDVGSLMVFALQKLHLSNKMQPCWKWLTSLQIAHNLFFLKGSFLVWVVIISVSIY